MTTIHVSGADGVSNSYTDQQLRSLWRQGILDNSSLYFIDGMAQWRPLNEYFNSVVTDQELAEQLVRQDGHLQFTRDPGNLTATLKVMLGLSLLVSVTSIVSNCLQFELLSSNDITADAVEVNDNRQALIGYAAIVNLFITPVTFLTWQYRANLNCHGFGADGMRSSPGWSVVYYFIPILNLFRPYQAMKEIWQVSADPRDWKSQPVGKVVVWWWSFWLLAFFANRISVRLSLEANTQDALRNATAISIGALLIDIALHVIAFLLVTKINEMQHALVEQQYS